jgi:hypothetical protein
VACSGLRSEDGRRTSIRAWLTLDRIRLEFGLLEACVMVFGPLRGIEIFEALRLAGVDD